MPARLATGVKVAVFPLTLTVPLMICELPPVTRCSVKLVLFSVAFVMASEKVAEIDPFNATPTALLAGAVEDTVGGVVSGAAPVVNRQA